MILFDETENKYYELLSYLINGKEEYSEDEINNIIAHYLQGEPDFEVIDVLFCTNEGEELVYRKREGKYVPIKKGKFPIRCTEVEKQALKSLLNDSYIQHFLNEETVTKISKATSSVAEEWTPKDITIKNLFEKGASQTTRAYESDISIIAKAIQNGAAIQYDYVRAGRAEYLGMKSFPVKIEFSVVNDRFRICSFDPEKSRFIKMNLDSLTNIAICEEKADFNLQEAYTNYINANNRKITLEVEPVNHVIERCFRVFSYYGRKARYDKEDNKYRLEITYQESDEREVIKNILSMGSAVVVIEPRRIQKIIYQRIEAACEQYQ